MAKHSTGLACNKFLSKNPQKLKSSQNGGKSEIFRKTYLKPRFGFPIRFSSKLREYF